MGKPKRSLRYSTAAVRPGCSQFRKIRLMAIKSPLHASFHTGRYAAVPPPPSFVHAQTNVAYVARTLFHSIT
jgi:hypothetical protein